jgi:hypothetical protein
VKSLRLEGTLLLGIGIAAGAVVTQLPFARASGVPVEDLSSRTFQVYVNEISQNFVFGEEFSGSYRKDVTLSDGSRRTIELTPVVHDGMQVIKFEDSGGTTYMDLNGTTTNGKLMVQVIDVEPRRAMLKEQGWKVPGQ